MLDRRRHRYLLRTSRPLLIGAALLTLSSMTAAAETPSQTASGIEGAIVVSPVRPGPTRKDDGPSVAPVRNTQFVVKAGDAAVATFTTDDAGRFQVRLKPGHYIVLLHGVLPPIGQWRFEVDVLPAQMTKVNWTADSGMR